MREAWIGLVNRGGVDRVGDEGCVNRVGNEGCVDRAGDEGCVDRVGEVWCDGYVCHKGSHDDFLIARGV